MLAARAPGSFRDPDSSVYREGRRILRGLRGGAAEGFRRLRACGLLEELVAEGRLVPTRELPQQFASALGAQYEMVVEHDRIDPITYPYEWSFGALRAAALLHLDVQLRSLADGISLCDASAYNIQFRGARPLLIDAGSFRIYREGELWLAYDQFMRQFVAPLLIASAAGVAFQPLLRGLPDGVPLEDLARLLPFSSKLRPRVLLHVVLPALLQRHAAHHLAGRAARQVRQHSLPRPRLRAMLEQLRGWIAALSPVRRGGVWLDYEANTSYSDAARRAKRDFVTHFVATTRPARLLDVGCNTGEYSALSLTSGAREAVGFETDSDAIEAAYRRAAESRLAFLPLYQDVANPSPAMGWRLTEREALRERLASDAVLALAVVHHLAIARNLPLAEVVAEIVACAGQGVIEFVDKADPMVQRLLVLRDDIFPDYNVAAFERALESCALIVRRTALEGGTRLLYWFERR
jgi:ribosomal protein L11 methylase PrmA